MLEENLALDKVEEGALERPVSKFYVLYGKVFNIVLWDLINVTRVVNLCNNLLHLEDGIPSGGSLKATELIILL